MIIKKLYKVFAAVFLMATVPLVATQGVMPKLSDVVFGSRYTRPISVTDPNSTLASLAAFHGTWVGWMGLNHGSAAVEYEIAMLNKIVAQGIPVQGATTCLVNATNTSTDPNALGMKLDVNQNPVSTKCGCPASPIFSAYFLQNAYDLFTYPIQAIQIDDWSFESYTVQEGSTKNLYKCYCNYCLENFRTFLSHQTPAALAAAGVTDPSTFDYRHYVLTNNLNPSEIKLQIEKWYNESAILTLNNFWTKTKPLIEAKAGFQIPISANALNWHGVPENFDFAVAEYPPSEFNAQSVYNAIQTNAAMNRPTVFTFLSTDVRLNRIMIGMTTASGGNMMVPWDVNLDIAGAPRYFGLPSQYADLYALIRAEANHLDGYEAYTVAGYQLNSGSVPSSYLQVLGSKTVSAYLRLRTPSNTSSTYAVIHVVDSSPTPTGCQLKIVGIPNVNLNNLVYTLTVPVPYNAAAHAAAQASGNFQPLVKRTVLQKTVSNGYITVTVPPVTPWGIIEVTYQ